MARNIITGIDIGTSATRVVMAEYTKGKNTPNILGIGVAQSRGLKHGYIVNKEDAVKSIKRALRLAEKSARTKIKSAFLSIGGISLEAQSADGVSVISRANEEVNDLDIGRAMSASEENLTGIANKKILHSIPVKFKLDGHEVLGNPDGMKGSKLEIKTLFFTCLEQHLNDLVNTVEEAGVEVEDVIAAPLAASLVALTKKQRTVGCALANIGAETVSISVFEDSMPISLQVFPIGSTDITNDIALGFKISLDEAEELKVKGPDGYPKRKLDEIIEARLSDIFELIEVHLKKIGRNGLLPAGIILTGGGAGVGEIESMAKSNLKLPSQVATPVANGNGQLRDSSWFVAYGLCIYGFGEARNSKQIKAIKNAGRSIIDWFKQFMP